MSGQRYASALALAIDAHGAQVRKATEIPYYSHPIAVSALVLEHGGDEDQAIIGVLHDVVEDCGLKWLDGIRTYFGDRVADGVMGCSDCSPVEGEAKAPWRERKDAYLRHLETASPDVLIVSACDKLHNAGSIVADLEDIGVAVFSRFRAGQEGTIWYYDALARVFGRRLRVSHPRLAARLSDMVARMKALSTKDTRAFV